MNIFHKVAIKGLVNNRTRTLVTIVGVALSAAMITAVATFGASLMDFLVNGSIAKYGNWHVSFPDVSSTFVQEREKDKEAAGAAAFENIGYAVLGGAKSEEKPYLFIAGFGSSAFDMLPIDLISGRLPSNSGEVLAPSHIAIKAGVRFRVGDTLSLAVGDRVAKDGSQGERLGQHDVYRSGDVPGTAGESLADTVNKSYTVVGIYERPGFEEHSAPGYTLITKAEETDAADSFSLFVTLKHPRSAQAYAEGAAGGMGYVLNDNLLRFLGASENTLFNALLYSIGGILVAIIMVGSVFLIYNSFHISLNERTQQFGIFLSVGATAKQLRNSVLFEGLMIGAVGIPLGAVAGIGSIGLVIPVIAEKFGNVIPVDVPLTLKVSVPALAAAAAVSLATILISAYIPARKAANTPVMECIRQTNEIKTGLRAVKTSKLAHRIYGLEGMLALKNFKRNKKRYRSIVLSLVLSLVLFVSGSAFGLTLKRLLAQITMDMDYDILFTAQDMDEEEWRSLYNKLRQTDGVYDSLFQTVYEYSCIAAADDLSEGYREYAGNSTPGEVIRLPMQLQFIEDREYLRFLEEMGLSETEYTGQGAHMTALAKLRVCDESGSTIGVLDVFEKDAVTLSVSPETDGKAAMGQGKSLNIRFVDTYPVEPPPTDFHSGEVNEHDTFVFLLVAPDSLRDHFDLLHVPSVTGLGFYAEDPLQAMGNMETVIQSEGITSDYKLYSIYAVVEQFRSLTFVTDVFTYIFVIMISLIAVANVFNTISTNIKLRRRELAMLRSVGMSDRDFNKMMNFECAFYGMRTLLYGIPISGVIAWLIYAGMKSVEELDDFQFVFPWGSMMISVLGVFFIVFITMLYATRKIKKENIIDALRDEMA